MAELMSTEYMSNPQNFNPEEPERSRLFRKATVFYSFLEGGLLKCAEVLIEKTTLNRNRINEILDLEEDQDIVMDEQEKQAISAVLGIPVSEMIWNQYMMNCLYRDFNLNYDIMISDFNRRVLMHHINPLGFARAVMATIFADNEIDIKEQKYFEFLKTRFNLTDEIIIPGEETSDIHFHNLIRSLPKDTRFLSIVVKWIIGAVFADGVVSPHEIQKLKELLNQIQTVRGELKGVKFNFIE